MNAIRHNLRTGPAMLLIAAALLARLLVPSGWMPGAGLSLELCVEWNGGNAFEREAQHVFAAVTGDAHGADPADSTKSKSSHQPCAFAALGLGCAGPVEVAALALSNAAAAPLLPTASAPAPGRGLAAPPPPATGPPFRA